MRGHRGNHQRRARQRGFERRGWLHAVDGDAREVAGILTRPRDLVDQRRAASPQPHRVADPRAVHRQRRAPAARAQDGDALAHRGAPTRRSVPSRMRRTLARWRNRISAAPPPAAATTGTGAPVTPPADGSVPVAASDPSEINRDSQTFEKKTAVATIVAAGASTANTPAATATPLPPWNRSHTG